MSYNECLRFLSIAVFDTQLQVVNCSDPKDLAIECQICQPHIYLQWFKGGEILKDNEKYSINKDKGICKLIIHQVKDDDVGEYIARFGEQISHKLIRDEGNLEQVKMSLKMHFCQCNVKGSCIRQ